jgi:F-type H+-transporting ATPase subunit epsilon
MAVTFKFELVSPERLVLEGEAERVSLAGVEGDMTILPGHGPVVATLRPGVLQAQLGGKTTRHFVKAAFAEVQPDRVTVLSDKAYDLEAMDAGTIASELAAAEAELRDAKGDAERFAASEAVSVLKRLKAH